MRNKRFPKYPDDADYTTNSNSYYDDLARKQKLIEMLSKKIWEYEETLDLTLKEITNRLESYIEENDTLMNERLEQWELNLENFPENVELLLQEWLSDGTLDHIINETIFNWKADKTYVDSEIERLDQKDENLTAMKADKTFVDSEIERLNKKDENLTAQLAQNVDNLDDRAINVLYPPENLNAVKGDGKTDDWEALQELINYGYDNEIDIYIPDGEYLTSKPLKVYGSSSAQRRGNVVYGASREGTVIKKTTTEHIGDGSGHDANAVMIVSGGEDANTTRSVTLSDFTLTRDDGIEVEYGLYLPSRTVSSHFEKIYTLKVANGIFMTDNNYLNKFRFIRIQQCVNGIYHDGGIVTSNIYESCYVNTCSGTAYKIYGNYVSIISPAADDCKGIVYDLKGLQGTVISPGSESTAANVTFDFSGPNPNYTNAVITGANTWMLDGENAEHIKMSAGAKATFVGGHINRDPNSSKSVAPGYLLNATSGNSVSLTILGVTANDYEKESEKEPSDTNINFTNDQIATNTIKPSKLLYKGRSVFNMNRKSVEWFDGENWVSNFSRGALYRLSTGSPMVVPSNQTTTIQWGHREYDTDSFLKDDTYFEVPKGVKKIKLSANINYSDAADNLTRLRILSDKSTTYPEIEMYSKVGSMNISSQVLKVSEGERFSVSLYHEHGSDRTLINHSRNWFSIEVVA